MKMFRTFAVTAASLMMVAGLASACDKHAAAQKASADKAGCAKKAEAVQTTAGHAGCNKATTTTASTAEGKGCCAKAAKVAKAGCCAKGETVTAQVGETADVKTCTFRPGAVAFKGTVLCNHCNLHKSETCQTMFRTESGCLFTLAGDKATSLKEEAGGGSKIVRIKGTVSEDGALTVSTYRVVRSVEGASAM